MGIQDNFFTIGEETVAWGTKATTLTRGFENQSDDVTPNVEFLQSRGMRPATVGIPTGRNVAVPRGGQFVATVDLMSASLGLFFAAVSSDVVTATPEDGTTSKVHTFTPTTGGPAKSFTIHAGRADISGTVNHHDYLGAMAESLNFALSPRGLPVLTETFNYRTLDTEAASVTPAYPTDPYVFRDIDFTISIDGDSECLRSADFSIPTGLDMERYRICAGGREKPLLYQRVEPTGTMSLDYDGDTWQDAWLNGTELENLVIEATGPELETGVNALWRVTFPLIQLTGASPKVGLDTTPEQPIPWRAIDNLVDPLWTIEYVTSDTAY